MSQLKYYSSMFVLSLAAGGWSAEARAQGAPPSRPTVGEPVLSSVEMSALMPPPETYEMPPLPTNGGMSKPMPVPEARTSYEAPSPGGVVRSAYRTTAPDPAAAPGTLERMDATSVRRASTQDSAYQGMPLYGYHADQSARANAPPRRMELPESALTDEKALPASSSYGALGSGHGLMGSSGLPPIGGPVPTELCKVSLPPYRIEPPDILVMDVQALELSAPHRSRQTRSEHVVAPDGTICLGTYGYVYVAGMTRPEAKTAIQRHLSQFVQEPEIALDVRAYNSKAYYVITEGGASGQRVFRFVCTGNETVLDAISNVPGLPAVASKRKVWVARPAPNRYQPDQALSVDWLAITEGGSTVTNYQIFPGDRIFVKADHPDKHDSARAKNPSAFDRLFGLSLVGCKTEP